MIIEASIKTKSMKKLLILAAAGVFAVACNNAPDNVKTAEKANDSLANQQSVTDSASTPSKQDVDFMIKATSGSQFEVVLGQLAQTNGASDGVKRFGAMMVNDHTKGEETFRGLAVSKHIILPDTISNDQKKEEADLQKKKGHDFDKAYIKMMVDDHKEDIDEFRKAAQSANDPDIRALAATNIPILQQHLDSVQALQRGGK